MTNVEKVKAGELAIFNDNQESINKILKHFKPENDWFPTMGNWKFWFYDPEKVCGFDFKDTTTLPTIPATVLLSEIEGKTQLTKEEAVNE